MSEIFKPGDIVKCTQAGGEPDLFTGQIYTVLSTSGKFVRVDNEPGITRNAGHFFWRFVKISESSEKEQIAREARIASFKKLADTLPDFQPRTFPSKPEKVRG